MADKELLSNSDIALFALNKLGGTTKKIHTEHIAWECYQLAPERFSWRLPEYRERGFPDKTPVRFALEQVKKKQGGQLVSGRAGGDVGGSESEGWMFTSNGIEWLKKNTTRIAQALNEEVVDIHPREVKRFLTKIKGEKAFIYYCQDNNLDRVTSYMFTDFLGCTPDASNDIVRRKFDRVMIMAKLIDDMNILKFFDSCEAKFANIIGR